MTEEEKQEEEEEEDEDEEVWQLASSGDAAPLVAPASRPKLIGSSPPVLPLTLTHASPNKTPRQRKSGRGVRCMNPTKQEGAAEEHQTVALRQSSSPNAVTGSAAHRVQSNARDAMETPERRQSDATPRPAV
ncbi:hypothetical protein EYF80_046657 [Liparis tanakae]|uniref:Uncharacterized protein n=1 Tax=Liparis tanakae TaxID=230148 RepID=A0A4Z2FQT5_9TELE|nr:hypothetical protein EYF80_046657 [Liparis tanakae]